MSTKDNKGVIHRALVNEEGGAGDTRVFRWECTCRRNGKWVATQESAERGAAAHERGVAPKPTGPKALRNLLTF